MITSLVLQTAEELKLLPPDMTVFIFPSGGVEQHGPHLPLGVKLYEAESMTRALAERLQEKMPHWNFILMPIIPFTVDTVTTSAALSVRPHVVRDALVDQCEGLKRLGFESFLAVSSHVTPRQLTAIEDAGKIIARKKWLFFGKKSIFLSISSALVAANEVWASPMIGIPKEHGGAFETGWMLELLPQAVSKSYVEMEDHPRPKADISRFIDYFRHEIGGYWGSPKAASVQNFKIEFDSWIESLATKVQPVLEKGQGESYFRSGYRLFPLNGSFFKAYILASAFFVLMLVWTIWSMRDVFDPS